MYLSWRRQFDPVLVLQVDGKLFLSTIRLNCQPVDFKSSNLKRSFLLKTQPNKPRFTYGRNRKMHASISNSASGQGSYLKGRVVTLWGHEMMDRIGTEGTDIFCLTHFMSLYEKYDFAFVFLSLEQLIYTSSMGRTPTIQRKTLCPTGNTYIIQYSDDYFWIKVET